MTEKQIEIIAILIGLGFVLVVVYILALILRAIIRWFIK